MRKENDPILALLRWERKCQWHDRDASREGVNLPSNMKQNRHDSDVALQPLDPQLVMWTPFRQNHLLNSGCITAWYTIILINNKLLQNTRLVKVLIWINNYTWVFRVIHGSNMCKLTHLKRIINANCHSSSTLNKFCMGFYGMCWRKKI